MNPDETTNNTTSSPNIYAEMVVPNGHIKDLKRGKELSPLIHACDRSFKVEITFGFLRLENKSLPVFNMYVWGTGTPHIKKR